MTWTDEELVARSQGGDIESFNQLILRWERPIYALAYRVIGREEDARDVCSGDVPAGVPRAAGLQGTGEVLVVAVSYRAQPVPRLDPSAAAGAGVADAGGVDAIRARGRTGAGSSRSRISSRGAN